MAAFGALLVVVLYILLALVPMIFLLRACFGDAGKRRSRIVAALVSAIPLVLFGGMRWYGHRTMELENARTYQLVEYPNCAGCTLVLDSSNTYAVRKGHAVLRTGTWKLLVGDDYYIVQMDEYEQLGAGVFAVKTDVNLK